METELTFTATSALNAGTEITVVGTSVSITGGSGTAVNSLGSNLSLASNGDQLIAYQGSFPTPTTFIAGIHMNVDVFVNPGDPPTTTAAAWDGVVPVGVANNNHSALPTGLTTGTNALWIGTQGDTSSERDNARFTCGPNVSTAALARAALNNPANWQTNNLTSAGFGLPTACGFLGQPTAAPATISGLVTTSDGSPLAGVTVNLGGGNLSGNTRTITDSNGQYRFERVETGGFYTVTPARANYNFSPAQRSFSQFGNGTDAAFTATAAGGFVNPLDTPEYFVRQHYLDFLGREPDGAGFNFWSDQILGCGANAGCIERRTINVSAAYFLSVEFQETGGLVDRLYRVSYGRAPRFAEFMPDTRTVAQDVVVGQGPWAQTLAANKQAFVDAWVQRPAFRAAYDGLSSSDFVDALTAHTGVSFGQAERAALVSSLNNQTATRAEVLREVAENDQFMNARRNEAFVMMQYFAYLRRDPDLAGFQFWLNKLNEFGGSFERAEMVKAFIVSGEYRDRFTH